MNTKLTFTTPKDAVKFAVTQPGAAQDGTTKGAKLTGYAIVWDATSGDRGGYVARMAKGSAQFAKDGVLALFNHETGQVLGNTANDTLKILPDDYGTRVEITLPDTSYARDVATLVKDGYVGGMSFGMTPIEWNDSEEDGQKVRTYSKFLVDEVTVTPVPAFIQTAVTTMYSKATTGTPSRDAHAIKLAEIRLAAATM